ncbi:MAG: hypothetical protein MHMPM18_000181 [Marteilia pararefringens]
MSFVGEAPPPQPHQMPYGTANALPKSNSQILCRNYTDDAPAIDLDQLMARYCDVDDSHAPKKNLSKNVDAIVDDIWSFLGLYKTIKKADKEKLEVFRIQILNDLQTTSAENLISIFDKLIARRISFMLKAINNCGTDIEILSLVSQSFVAIQDFELEINPFFVDHYARIDYDVSERQHLKQRLKLLYEMLFIESKDVQKLIISHCELLLLDDSDLSDETSSLLKDILMLQHKYSTFLQFGDMTKQFRSILESKISNYFIENPHFNDYINFLVSLTDYKDRIIVYFHAQSYATSIDLEFHEQILNAALQKMKFYREDELCPMTFFKFFDTPIISKHSKLTSLFSAVLEKYIDDSLVFYINLEKENKINDIKHLSNLLTSYYCIDLVFEKFFKTTIDHHRTNFGQFMNQNTVSVVLYNLIIHFDLFSDEIKACDVTTIMKIVTNFSENRDRIDLSKLSEQLGELLHEAYLNLLTERKIDQIEALIRNQYIVELIHRGFGSLYHLNDIFLKSSKLQDSMRNLLSSSDEAELSDFHFLPFFFCTAEYKGDFAFIKYPEQIQHVIDVCNSGDTPCKLALNPFYGSCDTEIYFELSCKTKVIRSNPFHIAILMYLQQSKTIDELASLLKYGTKELLPLLNYLLDVNLLESSVNQDDLTVYKLNEAFDCESDLFDIIS